MASQHNYYKISPEQSLIFASTFLLVNIARSQLTIPTHLTGSDYTLKDTIEYLITKGYIIEGTDETCHLTKKGSMKVTSFETRYAEILTYIDIFSAVDLEAGVFAFEKYGSFDTEEEWKDYLNQSNWADLRVAMIDYLDGNAAELVFSQLTLDHILTINGNFWQSNLTRGKWWRDIQQICDTAMQEENLGYTLDGKKISGESVLEDIFDQAIALLITFFPEENTLQSTLETWYPGETKTPEYATPIAIHSTSRPPWETPWTL